jgi:zinc transport system substrate-binding protein
LNWFTNIHTRAALAGAVMILAATTPARSEELKVVATIKPIHALVAQVMAGAGEPTLLIQGQDSPHTYAMKPSDAKALNGADIVFRVSEQIEPFTKKIVTSLPNTVKVVTLAETTGLVLYPARSGETFDAHDHANDHGSHDDHKDHNHAIHAEEPTDGHIWLDPDNAKMMLSDIARVLGEKSPAHAAVFSENAEKAIAKLDQLQNEIAGELAAVKHKPFAVFHDAYQYFEKAFDMNAIGSITVSPEVQPSAKRLSEVRAKITSMKAACVFAEPQFKAGLVETVIEGTGAKAGTLDPEGATVKAGPNAYSDLLRGLATGLKSCLAAAS